VKISIQTVQATLTGGVPRYRDRSGPIILSAGFRPFFLLAALWSALAVPLWLALLGGHATLPTALPAAVWHAHEMIFGFGAATVAGFLLTAIPNWTGRLPLQNVPLAGLAALWLAGRMALLLSETLGASVAAIADLAFPAVFLAVIAREIIAGRNWRNLPMLVALGLLLTGNLLVHLEALGLARTAAAGNRLGIATLLMLIGLVGGRIIPSFTGNWLAKHRRDVEPPAVFSRFDGSVLGVTALALAAWVFDPDSAVVPWAALLAGIGAFARLARWRGQATRSEPLLWILHLGYAWLGIGFLLLAASAAVPDLPASSALHALTAGAIGTMTLAVMTRASLGHTGRPLTAGPLTTTIYGLVTLAAILRVVAPLCGGHASLTLWLAGLSWAGAFGMFALAYGRILARRTEHAARAI
jgi:uncharacterized protein involved in response to NO